MSVPPFEAALRLAAIVESSDDAIVSKDLDGIVTSWNAAAERMFGYTAEEIIGRSIRTIIPDDRQSEEDEVLARLRRGEKVEHFETIRRRKDGTFLAISLTSSPIRNVDGTVIGASKIAHDITERRRNAAALERSRAAEADLQQRLRVLVEATAEILASPRVDHVLEAVLSVAGRILQTDGLAIWRLSADGQWQIRACAGVSTEFAAMTVAADHAAATTPAPFVERVLIEDVRDAALAAGRVEVYDAEGIRSIAAIPLVISGAVTGSLTLYKRRPYRFSTVEVETAQALGNMTAAALTTAELNEEQRRREREAAWAHARATFLADVGAALAESLDYRDTLRTVARLAVPRVADWCAIDIVEESGAVKRLAAAHVDPAKTLLLQSIAERYEHADSPHGVATVISLRAPILLPHITDAMIVEAAHGDQERIALVRGLGITSYMCAPLLARGQAIGAVTFVAAESGRRFTGQDLLFAQDVASRAALAVENSRAYDEARRANHLKDEFLATLSHELRTPLNAILGWARMLNSGTIGRDKQPRAFTILERNAATLTQIVADILEVSRITAGKLRLDRQPADLSVIVTDAVAAILPTADARGVALRAQIDPGVGPILADGDRLQQVIWNLVTNAVKFTPQGGRVDVTVEADGDGAIISVRDTGIGISPDFLPHVFERFRQGDSRFTREHGGLGLGLAIARHLVEMHGGTIHAESEGQGRGATFRVHLPMSSRPAPVAADV